VKFTAAFPAAGLRPTGIELKRNVKQAWWNAMVQERDDMVGIETSILMHPKVWMASAI